MRATRKEAKYDSLGHSDAHKLIQVRAKCVIQVRATCKQAKYETKESKVTQAHNLIQVRAKCDTSESNLTLTFKEAKCELNDICT